MAGDWYGRVLEDREHELRPWWYRHRMKLGRGSLVHMFRVDGLRGTVVDGKTKEDVDKLLAWLDEQQPMDLPRPRVGQVWALPEFDIEAMVVGVTPGVGGGLCAHLGGVQGSLEEGVAWPPHVFLEFGHLAFHFHAPPEIFLSGNCLRLIRGPGSPWGPEASGDKLSASLSHSDVGDEE